MRNKVIVVTVLMLLFTSCSKKNAIDTSKLDQYIVQTDSLNQKLSQAFNFTLNGIYHLIDDSLLADSISKMVILPDTVLFYQLLRYNIKDVNEIYYDARQEIFFAQDQLKGLKEDVADRQISEIQFEMQLESEKDMFDLLKLRTDSSIKVIQRISDILLLTPVDSISK